MSEPSVVFARELELSYEPVEPSQRVEGNPQTGLWEAEPDGQWGVWEMTPGAMSDVEVDEYFVVISGSGTLERTIGGEPEVVELSPGVVCRLNAGEDTIWRVSEALRKVYWLPQA